MKIDSKVKVRDIAGEKVVIVQGRYGTDMTRLVQLNDSAVWLLEQLAGRDFEAGDIRDLLCSHYEVDPETAEHDAAAWIEELRKGGLLAPMH